MPERRLSYGLAVAGVALMLLAGVKPALAERYLTIEQAQKLMFAEADRFEAGVVRFTPEQARLIERASGVPVRLPSQRYWVAHRQTKVLGALVVDQVIGKHELIDYAVAISPAGAVLQVEILEYRESHGSEIRGARWRQQFKGKDTRSPLKLHDDIYNISGATMSCRHVTEGVRRVLAGFELVVRPQLAGGDGVPTPAPR